MANTKSKIGMRVLAAAGAAAGYYFYASKDAKKNRKIAAKWANDMKNDVVKQAQKVRNIDQKQMLKIIDDAKTAYMSVRSVGTDDLARAAKELKSNWKELARELKPVAKSARASARKVVTAAKKHARAAVKTAKKTVK